MIQLPNHHYFITGTDTNCGKTYVTCQLLQALNQQGKRAQALKPVVSGARVLANQVVYDDVVNLQQYNYDKQQSINHWRYPDPISPHIASKAAGQVIKAQDIANFCQQPQFLTFDYVLIEGAGGLLAPINDNETWLDVMQVMALPVILVVGMRLGCLNHALLTASVLKSNHVPCAGWVANCIDKTMLVREENIATLEARMPMPLLAVIP